MSQHRRMAGSHAPDRRYITGSSRNEIFPDQFGEYLPWTSKAFCGSVPLVHAVANQFTFQFRVESTKKPNAAANTPPPPCRKTIAGLLDFARTHSCGPAVLLEARYNVLFFLDQRSTR